MSPPQVYFVNANAKSMFVLWVTLSYKTITHVNIYIYNYIFESYFVNS